MRSRSAHQAVLSENPILRFFSTHTLCKAACKSKTADNFLSIIQDKKGSLK